MRLPAGVRERVAAVHGGAALPERLRLYDGWAARYEQLHRRGFRCLHGVDGSAGMLERARSTGLYRQLWRALRRRDGGGGPGRGAGAKRGRAGAAARHQAGRLPLPDDEEQPLEPAVQGGAGGSAGEAGEAGSLAEGPGPGGGALGEGHLRGGEHPGHRLHLRGGLRLSEMPRAPPRGGLRADAALGRGWVSTWPLVEPSPATPSRSRAAAGG
ncbi:methyltransferase-like protein 27 isoform X3 [Calonectris borealis]|uniref:methyltransferase-like protein 27 isoform X3 n=1 Tax=Calonectris borealis TaxID=1323832 RepID=UPI003F4B41E5